MLFNENKEKAGGGEENEKEREKGKEEMKKENTRRRIRKSTRENEKKKEKGREEQSTFGDNVLEVANALMLKLSILLHWEMGKEMSRGERGRREG